jgi:hypothetical protein
LNRTTQNHLKHCTAYVKIDLPWHTHLQAPTKLI